MFTTRLSGAGRAGGRNKFESELRRLNITQKNGRPNHATPSALYSRLTKATPLGFRDHDTHNRVRRDRVDSSGSITLRVNCKLHHIGIGRTHARTHVIVLIQDLNVPVVHATTGEVLTELKVDPTRDYQPQKNRKIQNP